MTSKRYKISYTTGRKMVDDGELTEELFTKMQELGTIGPSPLQEKIQNLDSSTRDRVLSMYEKVDRFNEEHPGVQLRLQMLMSKE